MDSRFHGVPLSAAPVVPKAASFNNTITSGIRAPLTIDESDFEYSASSKSYRNSTTSSYYSGSEIESDGFVSGEDEYETASERTFTRDPDEGILENTLSVGKFQLSKPFIKRPKGVVRDSSSSIGRGFSPRTAKNPDGEIVQESGDGSKTPFFRPSVRKTEEINFRETSDSDESDGGMPLMSESDEEIVQDSGYGLEKGDSRRSGPVTSGEDRDNVSLPTVDIGMRMSNMPVAKISADSDTDSQNSELSEDNGFSGVVRVPSIEVLQRINSAPKVRISDVEEEEFEIQGGSLLNKDFVEKLTDISDLLDPKVGEKSIDLKVPIDTVASSDMFQYKDPDSTEEVGEITLVASKGYDPLSEPGRNKDFGNMRHAELYDHQEPPILAIFPEQTSFSSASEMLEPGPIESGDVYMDDGNAEIRNTGEQEIPVCNEKIEGDKLENISEVQRVESLNPFAVRKIGTLVQDIELGEAPSKSGLRFSETGSLLESKLIDIYDDLMESDSLWGADDTSQSVSLETELDRETINEAEHGEELPGESEISSFHSDCEAMVGEMEEMEREKESCSFLAGGILEEIGDPIVSNLDEEVNVEVGNSKYRQVIDSATLATLLKASNGANSGIVKLTSFRGLETFSLEEEPSTKEGSPYLSKPSATNGGLEEDLTEGEKKSLDRIQQIRVKYLRFLQILGLSPEDSIAARVLYHLMTVEERFSPQGFHVDPAGKLAMDIEVLDKNDLGFCLNILVIGKSGVGKSATINSIFGERKMVVDAFKPATTGVKEANGVINGVQVKVFDTPGLRASFLDHTFNQKVLLSIKKCMQKAPPDVVLYVDRLDTQIDNQDDLPILKAINTHLGASIWHKSVVALTHAASTPPEGMNGRPLSYEAFVAQRSQVIEEVISLSSGEMMNPESGLQLCLVENDVHFRDNEHNGEHWRSKLLLLCCSMKILSELNSIVLARTPSIGSYIRPPSLSRHLSSLLIFNFQHSSDSDGEDDTDEYDNLPPFKPLNKAQITSLSKEQRKAYFEEYDYRVKLLERKQTREVKRGDTCEKGDSDLVAIDPLLRDFPLSFNGIDPSFRYRFPESSSQVRMKPVFSPQGWDHDIGYDSVLIENQSDVASQFPATVFCVLKKDKQEFDLLLRSSVSTEHGNKGSTMAGLDIETIGEQLVCTLKGETRIKNLSFNKTSAGVSVTIAGENVVPGFKIEDHVELGNQCVLMGNVGVVKCRDDAAVGVNLEACLRHQDCPFSLDRSSLGLSFTKCRSNLSWQCLLQSQLSVNRDSSVNVGAGVRNDRRGKIWITVNTRDRPHLALLGFLPILRDLFRSIFPAP